MRLQHLRYGREALAAPELLSASLRAGSPGVTRGLPRAWREVTPVPWASPGSGFTLLFEAMVMLLAGQIPVREVARVMGGEDTRLRRLIQRLVEAAQASKDWSQVRAIAIDETSTRRGVVMRR